MSAFKKWKRTWRNTSSGDVELSPNFSKRQRTSCENGDEDQENRQHRSQRRLSRCDYTVGWICALPIEMAASKAMLDDIHEGLPTDRHDTNTYTLGNIGIHNIILACLPSRQYGTNNAATVASNMRRSFPSIRFGLMVGVGGGVPGKADIRLGDIVVSNEVVQYDLGKTVQGGRFERTGTLNKPPVALTTAVAKLQADHQSEPSRIPAILSEMLQKYPSMTGYTHPGILQDQLFNSTYDHIRSRDTCELCDKFRLLKRPARSNTYPKIHYGIVASGNQVMKHGKTRDQLAGELDALCFEMEAAGLMDSFPCLVVRGICDYSDSHKNKQWQEYAAATAAAYAKELLSVIPSNSITGTPEADANDDSEEHIFDRRKDLLKSLWFEQIDVRRSNIKANYSKTCQWLLAHSDYLDWVDPTKVIEHHGFLWIKGKPGAGKSTIMNFAYTQTTEDELNKVVSFFFNARGDNLERSATGMYRSLLFQLLTTLPSILDDLHAPEREGKLDALHAAIVRQQKSSKWRVEVLKGLLRTAISNLGQTSLTCFVDALDECDQDQVEGVVEYFEELGRYAISKGIQLRICFSSRHYPHIDIEFGRKLSLELQEGHAKDIAAYIQIKLKVGQGKSAEEIGKNIQVKADGIFMWVVLVVDILNAEYKRGRIFDVRKRLDTLPTKLSDLFREILWRDQENLQDMKLCIQWILFAERPLSLEEYYFAAVSGLSPDDLGEWNPEDITRADMGRFLLSSSKGLAETTTRSSPTVQFIHESVREFFLKDGVRELWPELTGDFQCYSHEQLKQCCLGYTKLNISRYLPHGTTLPPVYSSEAVTLRDSVLAKFPFLEYATRHVLYHADAAARGVSQYKFLKYFRRKAWINLDNLFEDSEMGRHTPSASLLYLLAEKNFSRLVRPALRLVARTSIQGERYQYPLFIALANGHRDVVRELFQREPSFSSEDDISAQLEYGTNFTAHAYRTPLEWATERGHALLAMHLIAANEHNLNPADNNGRTTLLCAAEKGYDGIVRLLLDTETVDADMKDYHDRALSLAAERGHEVIVRALLRAKGTDTNSKANGGQTPLAWAAENGHERIVRQLLQVEAIDASSKNSRGQTPLSLAAKKGHESIVKLLLETKGVDANSRDNVGQTSLSLAAIYEHEGVLKLLLASKGINTRSRDRAGRTPLSRAAEKGFEAGVRLLLANGADAEVSDNAGLTALSYAVRGGHNAVRRLLDNKGSALLLKKGPNVPAKKKHHQARWR